MSTRISRVALDWDGCGGTAGAVPYDLPQLVRLGELIHNKKIPVHLMTGRGPGFGEAVIKLIGLFGVPHVVESGGTIQIVNRDGSGLPARQFYHHPSIDMPSLETALSLCKHLLLKQGFTPENPKMTCLSVNPPGGISVLDYFETHPDVPASLDEICRTTKGLAWQHTHGAVDVTAKGVDKGTGLEWLSVLTDADLASFVVIGDSSSDINGMRVVVEAGGACACPGNANDKVKAFVEEHGGVIAGLPTTAGVVQILEHFFDV